MRAGREIVAVGFLPRKVAGDWQPLVREIEAEGNVPLVRAALYCAGDRTSYQVVLRLDDPERARFQNDEPMLAVLLDPGRECAVTEEQLHQDAIVDYATSVRPVWAT